MKDLANPVMFLPDLLAAEAAHLPLPGYFSRLITRSINPTARQDAVNWILKFNEFYHFSPVTGCLAVSYLDRFLSSNTLEFCWGMQLVAVACLSVAAKMEETQLPALLDLQILEPKYVFEAKTVAWMELHLMSSLGWRMHGVTSLDFIEPLLSPAAEAARPGLVSRVGRRRGSGSNSMPRRRVYDHSNSSGRAAVIVVGRMEFWK